MVRFTPTFSSKAKVSAEPTPLKTIPTQLTELLFSPEALVEKLLSISHKAGKENRFAQVDRKIEQARLATITTRPGSDRSSSSGGEDFTSSSLDTSSSSLDWAPAPQCQNWTQGPPRWPQAPVDLIERGSEIEIGKHVVALQGPTVSSRYHAAENLAALGPAAKTAVPDLRKALRSDSSAMVRKSAAIALGEIGMVVAEDLLTVTDLQQAAQWDADQYVRQRARQVLDKLGLDGKKFWQVLDKSGPAGSAQI